MLTQRFGFEAQRQGRQKQESEQRERSVQEMWKDHESVTFWAKSCPEASSSSAQVVLTSHPVSSPSEVAPPDLSAPVNNSANLENVAALAAILRDVLSPGGSSESARATRRATLAKSAGYVVRHKFPVFVARDQTKHLSMVVDSGAVVHLVCPARKDFLRNVTELTVPLQLETTGGDLTLDTIGDVLCGGIDRHGCVFNSLLSVSLFSTARGEKDTYFNERFSEGLRSVERTERKCEARAFGWSGLPSVARNNVFVLLCSHLARSTDATVAWKTWTSNVCAEDIWRSIRSARHARP